MRFKLLFVLLLLFVGCSKDSTEKHEKEKIIIDEFIIGEWKADNQEIEFHFEENYEFKTVLNDASLYGNYRIKETDHSTKITLNFDYLNTPMIFELNEFKDDKMKVIVMYDGKYENLTLMRI